MADSHGALGGAVAGLFLAMMRPAIFEARATIVMNRPTGSQNAPAAAGQALRTLFTNQGVAAQVLQETGLDRPPHNLAPATFVVENVAIDELVPGSMLVVRVRAADPDLAVKACNRLIALVTQLEGRVGAEEGMAGEDYIKQQLDSSRQKLDELESRLLDFKSRTQVDLRREDVRGLLDGRRDLIDLEMRLAAERGHLAAAESELVRRSLVARRTSCQAVQGPLQALRQRMPGPLMTRPPAATESARNRLTPVWEMCIGHSTTRRQVVASAWRGSRAGAASWSPRWALRSRRSGNSRNFIGMSWKRRAFRRNTTYRRRCTRTCSRGTNRRVFRLRVEARVPN